MRRCDVCGQPLPPIAGRGRPRTVCRDADSPSGRTGARSCRQIRNNRRDEGKRDHRYAASRTIPGAFPEAGDVLPPGATLAERMATGGFHDTTPEGRDYLVARRAHLDAVRREEQIERALRAEAIRERQERRDLCREVCPIMARFAPSPGVIRRLVARRRIKAVQ